MTSSNNSADFSIAFFSGDRKTGSISVVERRKQQTQIKHIGTAPETGLDKPLKPIFVGLTKDQEVVLLDPQSKAVSVQNSLPADSFPAHIYSDPEADRDWLMNDGDKQTGNDQLNCGDQGSSVTVIEHSARADARHLATICVGRGHHQADFSYPSANAPDVPRQAYISNLKDGTISVIGNDPEVADQYLAVVATINLSEPDKEEGGNTGIPNNAFPHGLAYSPLTGKIYNLNNGYGDVAVIDPKTHEIEDLIPFKGHSNLFATPDGRYLIGRGADRKSDANHVIARLTVMDAVTRSVVDQLDLQDVYVSKYYFNCEGNKLYLTSSSSGSPEQQANLKKDVLLVFDLATLPKLTLAEEVVLGSPSGALAIVGDNGSTRIIASSNSEEGALAVIDPETDAIIEKIPVTSANSHSRTWEVGRSAC